MEFAVPILSAAVGSAVSSAVPKLGRVIAKLVGKTKIDATFINDELRLIKDITRHNTPVVSNEWIAQLRRLAYEIEDCIDCFEVKKTNPEEFAEEIARLKTKSEETRQRLLHYIQIHRGLQKLAVTSSAQDQGQQVIAPAAAFEVLVPNELQELVGKQGEDWLNNLNCLLYFCMFPHDHHARRNPLIRRWLAEGLVRGEDDAVKYLKAFIDGKIINTTAKSNNGMMKRCQPPDEILRFIYQQSSATNFMLFCDDMAKLEAESARRLSLHPNEKALDDMNLPDFPHLHTLAVFHASANPDIYGAMLEFGNYEVLRVLDLKQCAPLSKGHLLAICKLLLLKYLSFQGGTDRLPSEIGKLAWLETLDMRGSETVTVHEEVLMMPRLKHLLGKFQLSRTDTIFWTVWDWKTTKVGKFLKQKSVLQTLSGFVTGDRRGFPQLMILMRKLRKVKIWCERNASEANLGDISSAITKFVRDGIQEPGRSLSISFQERSGQFLNNLQVQGALTSLKLHGNLSEFPQFVARLSGVEELCLSSTALTWNVILAELSKLSILKYLKLVEDNLGPVEILPEHLRSLERLCLVCEPNPDITINADALPGLVSLHIICQDLGVVPGTPGMEIKHMTNLQEVGLHSQVDVAIKQGWENAAEAHPNKPNVGTAILC
ncbi:unnamed protein product [Miscanthus lutarioriparius]|uniref:Rx N-terminal domain-containing protein n=1 Tax=Miscanthus lutarioriparius TaxID=422564 RepID=A0A811NGX6_9POAL|nr:unnamed protein product [Miscanthus lutarioriparius]